MSLWPNSRNTLKSVPKNWYSSDQGDIYAAGKDAKMAPSKALKMTNGSNDGKSSKLMNDEIIAAKTKHTAQTKLESFLIKIRYFH